MEYKDNFTSEEWLKILAMPTYVAGGVIVGDISGLSGLMKEGKALYEELDKALTDPTANPLAKEVVAELITREGEASQSALTKTATPEDLENTLEQFTESLTVLELHIETDISQGYKSWLYTIALATAQAAKERGFFGIGGVEVSANEKRILDLLAELLNISE